MAAAWVVLFLALWLVVVLLAALVLGLIRRVAALEAEVAARGRPSTEAGVAADEESEHTGAITPAT